MWHEIYFIFSDFKFYNSLGERDICGIYCSSNQILNIMLDYIPNFCVRKVWNMPAFHQIYNLDRNANALGVRKYPCSFFPWISEYIHCLILQDLFGGAIKCANRRFGKQFFINFHLFTSCPSSAIDNLFFYAIIRIV